MTWLLVIAAAWAVLILIALWADRQERAAVEEPAPHRPADSPGCGRCGGGDIIAACTCPAVCGHPDCVGDHTSLATLTAADMRLLHKWIREGHE